MKYDNYAKFKHIKLFDFSPSWDVVPNLWKKQLASSFTEY